MSKLAPAINCQLHGLGPFEVVLPGQFMGVPKLLSPNAATSTQAKTRIAGSNESPIHHGQAPFKLCDSPEALQELGFYPGEEDIEYSSFSSGTERAVKTWQATIGIREDGIMTAENLERLYAKQKNEDSGSTWNADPKGNRATPPQLCQIPCLLITILIRIGAGVVRLPSEKPGLIFFKGDNAKQGANGAVDSITGIFQQKVVDGVAKAELSSNRVFLLGENRWEDPSRLTSLKKPVSGVAGANSMGAATKCVTCRGEGRLLCTECDGTGEPNIEPQFMEWVDEGTKCPYCEGLGYTICDVCEGKAFIGMT
ncbi:hypothetical protein RJ639_040282 [Escallonia herrerae]|uniref:Peptidoglycan binding-like domain-containing protein n=1 Tax=Escallonia herrerae TaxID=1293975 RepID=A0AA88WV73_9ASTE|nr:hypothetical protein RJ639_040282 [Escallonia herrerae]